MGAAARAVLRDLGQVREAAQHVGRARVRDPEGPHAGGVDDPAAARQLQGLETGGGVTPPAGDLVDVTGYPVRAGHEGVDERRLADPRVPYEDADTSDDRLAQGIDAVPVRPRGGLVAAGAQPGRHRGHPERFVEGEQSGGVGQVGLGQHQQRPHAGVVGGHEVAVDHAGTRGGVRHGGDDDEQVGVGHDRSPRAGGVTVLGAPAQQRAALLDAHHAGQGAGAAAGVPDDGDPVPDDDPAAPQLARLHGRDVAVAVLGEGRIGQADAVVAAIDAGDHARDRVGVAGAPLGARARAPAGADPNPGVVGADIAAGRHRDPPPRPSMAAHRAGKPGRVLEVHPTSSRVTPSTPRPTMAAKVAIRWSA